LQRLKKEIGRPRKTECFSMADVQTTAKYRSSFTDEEIAAAEREADRCGDRFTTERLLGSAQPSEGTAGRATIVWMPAVAEHLRSQTQQVQAIANRLLQAPDQTGHEVLGRSRVLSEGGSDVLFRYDQPDKLVTVLAVKQSQ
jgi:hypothetical protein